MSERCQSRTIPDRTRCARMAVLRTPRGTAICQECDVIAAQKIHQRLFNYVPQTKEGAL